MQLQQLMVSMLMSKTTDNKYLVLKYILNKAHHTEPVVRSDVSHANKINSYQLNISKYFLKYHLPPNPRKKLPVSNLKPEVLSTRFSWP